ncbi:ABC transporter ATP-binding protein [Alicyclobacillus ferrooxydans]|uniref:Bacitracin ABC transporter ATP-binding protein n=1 Tax=Alicyclobacillus ferrooxydans TaxID=471514 RepID=A0A0N8PPB4_9BACL|nr:ABC transporter ATP-binding protein [Alicyclobacillus ferrooxydans]KPV43853.1 bacitracin ABC transporter ATP-binding protein [Alicyclobacillus ferrooxydans]
MESSVAVQLRNLTKTIRKKDIVSDLTFDIMRGEVFGLLGPNGAGKTTTIRMMVGLISMSRGQVLIDGIDVTKNFSEAMAKVGSIVENPEMYKYLTGYQNLLHFARMSSGVTKERINEVIAQVGLTNRIHEKVKTYSLGMRQRLGLAQALLRNPSVIILDEPTNGLDPAGIRELRDYLRNLAQTQGITVIVSSHLLSEMELMCDRVAIIQSGKLIDVRSLRASESTLHAVLTAFEVDDTARAVEVIKAKHQIEAVVQDDTVQVPLERSAIPAIVHSLSAAQVRIYAIRSVTKTLEDTFLEVTGGASHV